MSSDGPITSLAELYEALERHDWFHEMSDDHGVWERGSADWKRINKAAERLGLNAKRLVTDFSTYRMTYAHYSGIPSGTPEPPKPKLEDYL